MTCWKLIRATEKRYGWPRGLGSVEGVQGMSSERVRFEQNLGMNRLSMLTGQGLSRQSERQK
jgi:hypothetical protein